MTPDPGDELDQLRRYAEAVDRAAEDRLRLPMDVPSQPRWTRLEGWQPRLVLATAVALVVLLIGVGLWRSDDRDGSDVVASGDGRVGMTTSSLTSAAGGEVGSTIVGDDGCSVDVLPGGHRIEIGPLPIGGVFEPAAAHVVTSAGLRAEIHVPGVMVIDLVGEDVELVMIDLGQAALWRGRAGDPGAEDEFSQLRYFRGGQDRCGSFTVTATGGTSEQRDQLAMDLANQLRPAEADQVAATTVAPGPAGGAGAPLIRARDRYSAHRRVACLGIPYPNERLTAPTGAEAEEDAAAVALRTWLAERAQDSQWAQRQTGWRHLHTEGQTEVYGHGEPSADRTLAEVHVDRSTAGGPSVSAYTAGCTPLARPETGGLVYFDLVAVDGSVVHLLALNSFCNGGSPIDPEQIAAEVFFGPGAVGLLLSAPAPSEARCPSNPPVRVSVEVGEPIAGRRITDLSTLPSWDATTPRVATGRGPAG
ncbi:MAG TPA: hypothetical protein VJ804_01275 [Acidimicrobiales bacterium]|nr:hypothetical protein [Acidimicrobiales bacterium]